MIQTENHLLAELLSHQEKSPLIKTSLEAEIFTLLDYYFAKQSAKKAESASETLYLFLMYLMKNVREGHVAALITQHELLPKISQNNEALANEIQQAIIDGANCCPETLITPIRSEDETFSTLVGRLDNTYYLQRFYVNETKLVRFLKGIRNDASTGWNIERTRIASSINAEQEEAIIASSKEPLLIISGGPGRGKSFVAIEILKQFFQDSQSLKSVTLSAPTGKAVSHLENKVRRDPFLKNYSESIHAQTLHRLLAIREGKRKKTIKPICSDLLIIDECSMIDLSIWAELIDALSPQTRLILIGDPHQLPPIETGSIFQDLARIPEIPHVELKQCLRSDNQEILEFSDAIFSSNRDTIADFLEQKEGSVSFTKLGAASEVLGAALDRFPQPSDTKPDGSLLSERLSNFTILCSLRKGPYGVEELNQEVQQMLLGRRKTWLPIPIIITKNSYELDLYNGEVGLLLKHRDDPQQSVAYFNGKTFMPAILPPYEKAWCLSVHKSQGSEYRDVYFLLSEGSDTFGKEMLYTAVTRAKHSIKVFSDPKYLLEALMQHSYKQSFLVERMKEPSYCKVIEN